MVLSSIILSLGLILLLIVNFLFEAFQEVSIADISEKSEQNKALEQLLEWKYISDEILLTLQFAKSTILVITSVLIVVVVFQNYDLLSLSILYGVLAIFVPLVSIIIPKLLARGFAHRQLPLLRIGIQSVLLIFYPFYLISRYVSKVNERTQPEEEEAVREEIDEIIETAHDEGTLETSEYRLLKNIIRFSEVTVADVMTPRTVIFGASADVTIGEVVQFPEIRHYSRFPIWENDSVDEIVGYCLTKDLLFSLVDVSPKTLLRDIARSVYFIPDNIDLENALRNFIERKEHLFVVVDEYGGVEGLLTMEDVMETILGVEIIDEADEITDLRALAKHRRDQRIASAKIQVITDSTENVEQSKENMNSESNGVVPHNTVQTLEHENR